MTLHTKPAENTSDHLGQHTIVAELASAFALVTLGSRLASAASPPLRLAARARIVLNEAIAPQSQLAGSRLRPRSTKVCRQSGRSASSRPELRQAAQQRGDRDLALDAGELSAKAEMDAAAEREGRMLGRVMSRRSGSG